MRHPIIRAMLCLLVPAFLSAQQRDAPRVDAATARRVADSVAAMVERHYVFPDTGRMIAEHLRRIISSGTYDAPMNALQFADRLSADMKGITRDAHLYVNFAGGAALAPGGPQMVLRRPGEVSPEAALQARRTNHDVRAVERLAGNVGYLAIDLLSVRGDETYAVIDAAMALLERSDALILDLRRTRGGEPRLADYVASYFFGPEPTPTLNSYSRRLDRTDQRTTVRVTGKPRPDIPLYVLVGPGTASGGEDLAFILKQTGRATIVGERTAGAGRLTSLYSVGDGFAASISGGRTFDPRTGKEWERTGIERDIESNVAGALTAAHAAALENLASATPDSAWRRSLAWARDALLARATPAAVPASVLEQYAGTYEQRIITFESGKLWYQREANRAKEELTPIDRETFALGEASRIQFVRSDGAVTDMRVAMTPDQVFSFRLSSPPRSQTP